MEKHFDKTKLVKAAAAPASLSHLENEDGATAAWLTDDKIDQNRLINQSPSILMTW